MQTVIMIRMSGLVPKDVQKAKREQLIEQMKEGLFIVDDTVQEVAVLNLNDLGLEFNIDEEK